MPDSILPAGEGFYDTDIDRIARRAKPSAPASGDKPAEKPADPAAVDPSAPAAEITKREKALKPAEALVEQGPVKFPEPGPRPELHETQPLQAFGSVASALGVIGGLLTKHPLTASLNASTAAMNAIREGDLATYDSQIKAWRENAEFAQKRAAFEAGQYGAAVDLMKTDWASGAGMARALMAKNQVQQAELVLALGPKGFEDWVTAQKRLAIEMQNATTSAGNLAENIRSHKVMEGRMPVDQATFKDLVENQHMKPLDALKKLKDLTENQYDAPKEVEITDKTTGKSKVVLAQQSKASSQWVTADESRTPIDASDIKLVKGGDMSGRESVFTHRILTSANEAAGDLGNVVQLPLTSSTGWFAGRQQGPGLMDATKEVLANKLTTQEVQSYNVMATGFQRSLATIEASGLMPSGSLTHQMDAVMFREGDTNLTKLQKLAQTRQIVEKGLEVVLSNSRIGKAEEEQTRGIVKKLEEAVPFTQSDLMKLFAAQQTNPAATLKDTMPKIKQSYEVGQEIERGGKRYKVTGGDPRDPDIEEIK